MQKYINRGIILFLIICFGLLLSLRSKYMKIYHDGVALLESGNYEKAIECFENIPNYEGYQDIRELLNIHVCPQCGAPIQR